METPAGSGGVLDVYPLTGRVYWLIRLRWLAVGALVGILLIASEFFRIQLRLFDLFFIAGIIALFNAAMLLTCRWLRIQEDRTDKKARLLINVQITTDLLMLAALIHYSGGVENPFAFYFIFHVIVSGALLSPTEAWLQAAAASILFCGVVALEYFGVLAHYHVPGLAPPDIYRNHVVVTANIAAFASTIGLAAFTGISISHLVREKQQESRALIARLEEAYRRLDEFGRSRARHMRRISHELRAPLGAIQNLLVMLQDTLTSEDLTEERNLANRASKRVGQALKLVDDLLILARSQDARFTVTMKEVHLPHIIEDVVTMLRPRAEKEGIIVNVDVSRDLPPVLGDAESLQQLHTNLTANAIKYTPRGGHVNITATARNDCILVKVADTGIGVSEEDLPHIFDEFYRGENARQFAEQGTGLGLSIVKSIADMHGADVRVQSMVGSGTIFEIGLPMFGADRTARSETF